MKRRSSFIEWLEAVLYLFVFFLCTRLVSPRGHDVGTSSARDRAFDLHVSIQYHRICVRHRSRRSSFLIYRERRDSIVSLVPSIAPGYSFVLHLTLHCSNEVWFTGECHLVNALRTTNASRVDESFVSRLARLCKKRTFKFVMRWKGELLEPQSTNYRSTSEFANIQVEEDRVRANEQIQRADERYPRNRRKLQRITSFVVNSARLNPVSAKRDDLKKKRKKRKILVTQFRGTGWTSSTTE